MRTSRRFLLVIALAASGVVMGGGPAAAADPPKAGDACTVAEIGQRWPSIDSATVEPVITHFRSFFVTAGSTGEQQVRMEVQNVIEVMVNNERSIKVGFNIQSLFNVEAFAKQFVQKTTRSTNIEAETITWRFNEPGHYGVYKGTRTVTGRYSGINCHRVTKPDGTTRLEWIARPGGPYTTFSHEEMGAIRCVDEVPANSLMRKAQEQLGCFGPSAAPRPAPDSRPATVGTAAAGPPPGFTCDPVAYRLGLGNGLYWYFPGTGVEMRPYNPALQGFGFDLCRGPGTGDLVEHVLMPLGSDLCLSSKETGVNEDGSTVNDDPCLTIDDNQRWYLYRDAPNSNAVGLQVKRNGFMLGQTRVVDRSPMRLYSSGLPDGTGTYFLERIP